VAQLFLLGGELLRDDHPALPKDSQESRSQGDRIFFFATAGRVFFIAILLTLMASFQSPISEPVDFSLAFLFNHLRSIFAPIFRGRCSILGSIYRETT
jgi:hypothetical protein